MTTLSTIESCPGCGIVVGHGLRGLTFTMAPCYHDGMTTDTTTVYACPDHAPMGIRPLPFDDGRATCTVCGSFGYHVAPFVLRADVVARGWRMPDMRHGTIGGVVGG